MTTRRDVLTAIPATGAAFVLGQLASLMGEFDPRFEIMPGTKGRTAAPRRARPA